MNVRSMAAVPIAALAAAAAIIAGITAADAAVTSNRAAGAAHASQRSCNSDLCLNTNQSGDHYTEKVVNVAAPAGHAAIAVTPGGRYRGPVLKPGQSWSKTITITQSAAVVCASIGASPSLCVSVTR